jgi:uncharacterized membrane protein YhaH (DUF805 family)
MNWFVEALKKYAVFSGRAHRREYWYFSLIYLGISIFLIGIDSIIGKFDSTTGAGPISGLFGLLILLPSLAVSVRRLHDTDRSGWWCLIVLLPFLGIFIFIWFAAQPGSPGNNRFGAPPPDEA